MANRPQARYRHAALELARTVVEGPYLTSAGTDADRERLKADYRLWMSTWVLPQLKALVPELADLDFHACTSQKQTVYLPGYAPRPEDNKEADRG